MKKLKILGLTLFLSIGLILPSCEKGKDSCDGVVFTPYFDVAGISVSSYFAYSSYGEGNKIPPADTVAFEELDKIFIDYLVDYLASSQPKWDWSISLRSNRQYGL